MANIFTKHPKEVGESYLQHLWGAWKYSFILLLLFLTAFIPVSYTHLTLPTNREV